jgi:hypothetical protein
LSDAFILDQDAAASAINQLDDENRISPDVYVQMGRDRPVILSQDYLKNKVRHGSAL